MSWLNRNLSVHPGSLKRGLFRSSFVLAVLSLMALVIYAAFTPSQVSPSVLTGWIGATVAFLFAGQKQHAEEIRLFDSLFDRFNCRYQELHEQINAIQRIQDELTDSELDILYKYFNLCGEEYLYYSEGFIYPQAWEAWKAGMRILYQTPHIESVWAKELESNSYYGLTSAEILRDRR